MAAGRSGRGARGERARGLPWLAVLALALAGPAAAADTADFVRGDPTKYVGPEECGQCHGSEFEVWEASPHNQGAETLDKERGEESYAIVERMGFDLIRRDSVCLECHFTVRFKRNRLRALEGVSCESCHGPAADWLNVHNDYGRANGQAAEFCPEGSSGTGPTGKPCETPEHRAERMEAAAAAGMRRPREDIYSLAENCLGCHLVPNEKLVNVGQHKAGSGTFEFVEWSERPEIDHDFLDSYRTGDGRTKGETSDARRRLMYVVGRMAELAVSMRSAAEATEDGRYLAAQVRRAEDAKFALLDVSDAVEGAVPQIDAVLRIADATPVGLGKASALRRAADRIADQARALQASFDGARFAGLDDLIRGTVEIAEADAGAVAGEPGAGDDGTPGAAPATADGSAGAAPTSGPPPTGIRRRPPAAGDPNLRGVSLAGTVGPSNCDSSPGCHLNEQKWWKTDAHYRSKDPFRKQSRSADVSKIARAYGVSDADLTNGKGPCMYCHGTVARAGSSRPIRDGVSCESCHGPASRFLEPHEAIEKDDEAAGANRPAYRKALSLGMVNLLDARTRAENCASCHYITDPRLVSTGHPTGKSSFDIVKRMGEIEHWDGVPAVGGSALASAWQQVVSGRGPVPTVAVVEGAAPTGGGGPTSSVVPGTAPVAGAPRPRPVALAPISSVPVPGAAGVELEPFPEIEGDAPVEDVLLQLERRLQQLYEATGGSR